MIVPPFHGWMTGPPPPIEKRNKFSLSPSPQNPKKEKIAYRAFLTGWIPIVL
jgi:hypothetical protein